MPDKSDNAHAMLRAALKSQYHAAIAMLRQAIERCPPEAWTDKSGHPAAYWHIAYHAIFFTDFYLHPDHESFTPQDFHREGIQGFAPHGPEDLGEPYTQQQLLDYLDRVDADVDARIDGMALDATESGFPWYAMPKLEHQLVNIRHIQHHAAQLADRLRLAADTGIDWVGGKKA